MKVASIGDAIYSVYEKEGLYIIGGNAANFAVNMQCLGVPTALISTVGSDEWGRRLRATMEAEGLDTSHLATCEGKTAIGYARLEGDERIFLDYEENVLLQRPFSQEDIDFAAGHDLVYSALWGRAEDVLPAIRARGAKIAFDFADEREYDDPEIDFPVRDKMLPHVDYGQFALPGPGPGAEAFLKRAHQHGMTLALGTFGAQGSLVYDGSGFTRGQAVPAEKLVSTEGAGDSFFAGFMCGVLRGLSLGESLALGARTATGVIAVQENWVPRAR